jgi:hypothetical protein
MSNNIARGSSDVVGRKAKPEMEPVTLRLHQDLLSMADELAALLSQPGLPKTRQDAIREALSRGLVELLAQHKPKPKR